MVRTRGRRSELRKKTDRLIGLGLTAIWYFGGAALLIAGQPLWAALALTAGALAVWTVRNRRLAQIEAAEARMPLLPEARMLDTDERAATTAGDAETNKGRLPAASVTSTASAYCASFGFSLSSLPRNLSPSVAPPAFGDA